jgi:hypothetical protein
MVTGCVETDGTATTCVAPEGFAEAPGPTGSIAWSVVGCGSSAAGGAAFGSTSEVGLGSSLVVTA